MKGDGSFRLILKNATVESIPDVEAEFTLVNKTLQNQTFGFSSGCQFGFTVERGEEVIFDSRQNLLCTAALTSFTLQPGENKTFPISFNRFGSSTEDDLQDIQSGKYTLTAFLLNEQSPEISKSFEVL